MVESLITCFFLILDFVITLVPLLVMVALLTLIERKLMGAIQRRRGPNVVGRFGILQPFADGIKLIGKQFVIPTNTNKVLFVSGPVFSFSISLTLWSVVPFGGGYPHLYFFDNDFTLLLLFGLSSLGVYGLILSGWASNSFYAFLGSLRASAQMLSYEVSFALTLLPVVIIAGSFNLREIVLDQSGGFLYNGLVLFPSLFTFFISILAETNRTPFDLPEAEGELVAGFNVEYSAIFFAMFFLAEYANIILMAVLTTLIFLGGWLPSLPIHGFSVMGMLALFIVVRAILPRYRYDQLIVLGWKTLLPFTMGYFLFVAGNTYAVTQLL